MYSRSSNLLVTLRIPSSYVLTHNVLNLFILCTSTLAMDLLASTSKQTMQSYLSHSYTCSNLPPCTSITMTFQRRSCSIPLPELTYLHLYSNFYTSITMNYIITKSCSFFVPRINFCVQIIRCTHIHY